MFINIYTIFLFIHYSCVLIIIIILFLDCNKVLLVYGLTNLAKMGDDSLDKMDPYQRGSRIMSMYQ